MGSRLSRAYWTGEQRGVVMTPELDSIISMYFRGMLKMPTWIKEHLRKCDSLPSECLLCGITQRIIDQME